MYQHYCNTVRFSNNFYRLFSGAAIVEFFNNHAVIAPFATSKMGFSTIRNPEMAW